MTVLPFPKRLADRGPLTTRDAAFCQFFHAVADTVGHYIAATNIELLVSDFTAGCKPEETIAFLRGDAAPSERP